MGGLVLLLGSPAGRPGRRGARPVPTALQVGVVVAAPPASGHFRRVVRVGRRQLSNLRRRRVVGGAELWPPAGRVQEVSLFLGSKMARFDLNNRLEYKHTEKLIWEKRAEKSRIAIQLFPRRLSDIPPESNSLPCQHTFTDVMQV